jgi:hypothetical protein
LVADLQASQMFLKLLTRQRLVKRVSSHSWQGPGRRATGRTIREHATVTPAEACASSTTVGSSSGFRNSGWAGWLEPLHVVEGTEAGLISAGQVPRSSSMIEFSSEPREQSPSFNPGQTKADT